MYLTQPLHRNAQQFPDAVATICGERTRTHSESLDRISRLAGALRANGIDHDDRVAILGLNSDRYYEVLFAVPWADAVVVPVNTRWAAAEIAYSLNEVGAKLICVDDAFTGLIPELQQLCPALMTVIHWGEGPTPPQMLAIENLITQAAPVADANRQGNSLAGVFYTGGTTGFPKGVMLSHRNLFTSALGASAAGAFNRRGTILHTAPMFHLADLAAVIALSVLGGTHVVLPVFDPVGVLAAIAEHHITDLLLVPTMIQMVVDHPRRAEFDLSTVGCLMYGASPIPESLLTRARAVFPAAKFVQAYGMTEVAPVATLLLDDDHDDPHRRRSAGRAAPHSLVRIVGEDGVEVPRGTFGEIAVSGDHVMLGYWEKPDETAAAVRDGWMHTGDGGIMDEAGYVFIADRIKDMIITGGENVYSVEVENCIGKHPAVAQCAVIAVPDENWGERVHAIVSVLPGETLALEELKDHCRHDLAGYKIPRSLEIIDQLPMSAAGKILKRELRERHHNANSEYAACERLS
jgi:acyl-CoA synthetase (AMP-forming)/AMP-acid ligase II